MSTARDLISFDINVTMPKNVLEMDKALIERTRVVTLELLRFLQRLVKINIDSGDAIATGEFYRSIAYTTPVFSGNRFSALVYSTDNDKKVQALERGLPPGTFPPVDAILKWMVVRGIRPTEADALRSFAFAVNAKRKRDAKRPLPIDVILDWARSHGIQPDKDLALRSLAFAIAKSIERRGLKPRSFFAEATSVFSSAGFDGFKEIHRWLLRGVSP